MGITRHEIYTDKVNKLANMMRVLGHPARIAIIQYIIKGGSCICNDIVEELGLAQATVSQHLKELKEVGLIKGYVEGSRVSYSIEAKTWRQFRAACSAFFVAYESEKTHA